MSKTLILRLENQNTPTRIHIGQGILTHLKKLPELPGKRVFIFADRRVAKLAQLFAKTLEKKGHLTTCFWVNTAEEFKDFQNIYSYYGQLLKHGADRESVLCAFGGGVIGDAVGFLAGTYQRGLPWISVPTTLLAQVDSAIGGKTGVNHEKGKNLIGLFHHPILALCDPGALKSLPPREFSSGLGEITKYGLIRHPALFRKIQRNYQRVLNGDLDFIETLVATCLSIKGTIVKSDERDQTGRREVLNFGHTLGHALEAETGFQYFRHGEAVIWGMRAALILSQIRGHLSSEDLMKIDSFLGKIPCPPLPQKLKIDSLKKRVRWDKKSRNGRIRFVLLKKVGETILDPGVQDTEIRETIDRLRKAPQWIES